MSIVKKKKMSADVMEELKVRVRDGKQLREIRVLYV